METEGDPETQSNREVQNDQIMSAPNEMMAKEPEDTLIVASQAQVPGEPSGHPPKSLDEECVKGVEIVPGSNPLSPATFRQMFRKFQYKDAAGPRDVFGNLSELAREWLRPDIHTMEQIIEMLVQEQFQAILPEEFKAQVQKCQPGARFTG